MSKTITIDNQLDSYQTFFDHGWARRIIHLADGSALDEIIFDLCAAWRGAANTHYLPWLMLQSMKSFAEGLAQSYEPFGKRWLSAMATRLPAEMGDSLSPEQHQRLSDTLRRLDGEVRTALVDESYEFDGNGFFRNLSEMSEFQFCLWGSQRLCYGAVYYAYEDFLLRSYKVVTNQASYQIRADDFSKDFAAAFGAALRDYCWSATEVNVARLTRHALVHNGGRMTDKLKKQKHNLQVENGDIQIMPADTKALYDSLKERALKLVTEATPRLPARTGS